MRGQDPGRAEELLARRRDLLEALRSGPASKPDLVEALSVSRSTVDRAVRELESLDMVERTRDGVTLRLPGRLALDSHVEYRAYLRTLSRATAVLSGLEADVPFDRSLLLDATVVTAVSHEPSRPTEGLLEVLDVAERVLVYGSTFLPEVADACYENIVHGEMEADMILTEEVVEKLVADRTGEIEAAVDNGLAVYQLEEPVAPYSLTLSELPTGPVVTVLVNGERGVRGMVRSERPEAARWARHRLERLRERSVRIVG